MPGTETAQLQCPYCWERIEIVVDCSVAHQEYVEDCSVCCRPIVIAARCAEGELTELRARSEDA